MAKTILVTGAAGFLGSHLCDRLLDEDYELICVDNFFTGRKENIRHLLHHERFELIRHDITFPFYLEVDAIFNFACPASPVHYQYNPVMTTKCCVQGMINVLGLAKRLKVPVLQASTSEVYGDPVQHPQVESYWGHVNPIGIRACYDEGKRCAETLCFDYHRQYQVAIKIIRIFNTYGPRMNPDDGRVVSNFIVRLLKGQPIDIYGDGSQTRSFCYVDDMIEGILRMTASPTNCTGPINLGNSHETSILDLAERIAELLETPLKVRHLPLPENDPIRRQPDIRKAKAELDWSPTVGLDEGLQRTIAYFKQVL